MDIDLKKVLAIAVSRSAVVHTHDAADIASGTIATAQLGSGVANSTTYLRGDQTWAAPASGGYALVEDEGIAATVRTTLNFVGAGVTVTDSGGKTQVSVPGGGGSSATTVEVNLGSSAMWTGKFTITDAAIGGTSKVLCWQAPGPYTGKGARADEAEIQPVQVIAVEPAAGSAVVKWQTPPMVADVEQINRTNAWGTQANQGANNDFRFTAKRLGKVRGNVKFSYMVLA